MDKFLFALFMLFFSVYSMAGTAPGDVFLEAELNTNGVYVQSQVVYTLRLLYRINLQNGSLTDPSAPNVNFIRLGSDRNYETTRQGQRYQVIERRYALFPQNNGSVSIVPATFIGEKNDELLNTTASLVRVIAPVLSLQVLEKPAVGDHGWWLPARKVTIAETRLDNLPALHAGDPITRVITLEAVGTNLAQLPELIQPTLPGVKIYPSPSQASTITDGQWVSARRVIKVTLIPTVAGAIKLPALQVPWWNTETNQMAVAVLPARTLNVLPRLGDNSRSSPGAVAQLPVKKVVHYTILLLIGALVACGLGMVLLGWKIHQWRIKSRVKENTFKMLSARLKQSCQKNQALQAKQALMEWSILHWPRQIIRNLGELALRVEAPELRYAIVSLDKFLYSDQADRWRGDNLWEWFSRYNTRLPRRKKPARDLLPPLYLE